MENKPGNSQINTADLQQVHTAEERRYTIKRPGREAQIVVEDAVEDLVEGERYTKRIRTTVLQCDCCGALCSLDLDSRYKPPAGRCTNPEHGGLLCARHLEEVFACRACRVGLCLACKHETANGIVFCASCFKEFAEEQDRQEISACLRKE